MITIDLTERELVLVRVALIQRLDRLKRKAEGCAKSDPVRADAMMHSYQETKQMLEAGGKLVLTVRTLREYQRQSRSDIMKEMFETNEEQRYHDKKVKP